MRLLGFEITRSKAVTPTSYSLGDRGNWWYPIIHEPFTGAWQRNLEERHETLLAHHAVYACVTLIASDIAKCRIKLVQRSDQNIWEEIENAAHSPVLRKPNDYQTRIQFFEHWLISKLTSGNTYVLKQRDARGVVMALYVLDPLRVKTLVTDDGSVFYELRRDNLSGVEGRDNENIRVPASEIIHDMCTLRYHPLYGVPPLAAAAMAASQGLQIQRQSIRIYRNSSRPSGILTPDGPGRISQDDKKRIEEHWREAFTGPNAGRVSVMSGDMKYIPLEQSAVDSQLIEQLNISAQMVCSSFQVPGFMVGVGTTPSFNSVESLNQQYYSQCLQKHFESIELALDHGLGLTEIIGKTMGTEFDLDGLLRMDTATRVKTYAEAVKGGIFKPNEARAFFDLPNVEGGDEVYLQQQNFSLAALAKRDAKDDPFSTGGGSSGAAPSPSNGGGTDGTDNQTSQDQGTEDELAAAKQMAAWELKKQLDLLAA